MEKQTKTTKKPTNTKKTTTTAKKTTTKKTADTPKKKTTKKKPLAAPAVKTTKVNTPAAKVTKKQTTKTDILDQVVVTENQKVDLAKSVTVQPKVKKMPDVKRPQPTKVKVLNKEEKALFKKLEDAFTYVANLTLVIEEKTMDVKQIPDLTISELHVVEMVNKYNNKPMTIIARKLNVTVGSLITCVNRLIQKDYLIRTRDEMDHRVILLSVTPKAKKVLKVHDKFHSDILNMVLEGVTLQQATKVMTQFATVLDNYMYPVEEKKDQKDKKEVKEKKVKKVNK